MKILSNGRLTKNTLSLVTATCAVVVGLSACGKFSPIDPKAKGTSTNSNPLAAEEEDRLRDLVASTSPTPSPTPGQEPAPAADDAGRDAALDQARQLFSDELKGRTAGHGASPAPAAGSPPAPVVADGAAADAPPVLVTPEGTAGAAAPPSPITEPASAQPAQSKALIAEDVSDEAKRNLILQLIEPTMRINFRLSLQRGEILGLKKILDAKKELSAEQAAKLSRFKQSYLLIDTDSIDALVSRVDVVNTHLQIAPFLLKSNWQTQGSISQEEIAARVQMLNTHPSDAAIRFRSARQAMKLSNEKPTANKIMAAELAYNPDSEKNEVAENTLKTIDEVRRIMALYPAEIDKEIAAVSEKLEAEYKKK